MIAHLHDRKYSGGRGGPLNAVRPELHCMSLWDYVELVQQGYPLGRALALSDALAPNDSAFRRRMLPRSVIARVKQSADPSAALSKRRGEVMARLELVWFRVRRLHEGNDAAARRFLFKPFELLDGQAPIDLALKGEAHAAFLNDVLKEFERNAVELRRSSEAPDQRRDA